MSKNNSVELDDYYNDGLIELVRHGSIVSMKNLLTSEQHEQQIDYFAERFEEEKRKIDHLVEQIREDIKKCNPLELLNFSNAISFISMINKVSEIEYEQDEIYTMRCTEYIQSILVSSENKFNVDSDIEYEELSHTIINKIVELYKDIQFFYWYWGAYAQKKLGIEDELIKYIVEAQMLWNVRGNKYQNHQVTDLEKLLIVHEDILIKLFDISATDLIAGIKSLEYSLSSGKPDALMKIMEMFDEFQKFMEENPTQEQIDSFIKENRFKTDAPMKNVFGNGLYDVKTITGWSDLFIEELSYDLNANNDFFGKNEYAGWPIIDLPVQKKPFIKIDDKSFCFDYYNFFDNIYRNVQKAISRKAPEYSPTWSSKQQHASESLVEEIIHGLLPNATIYRDNYYPKKNSLKDCAENDLIVIYDSIVIIIEVKAGSFTYTPPITDYQAHIKSFKTLIEKADFQCERTYNYLDKDQRAKFYHHNKSEKFEVDMSEVSDVFTLSVTVDNFNEFESKAEKLSFIDLMAGSIAISLDDLRVYADYFNNPLFFLHFLKERKAATKSSILALNDELDHLGMYIKHNMYTLHLSDEDNCTLSAYGYRENLDKYFGTLHVDELIFEKPEQDIPFTIKSIIELVDLKEIKNRILLSNYLLDFSNEARIQLDESINHMLIRQKEIGRMITSITFGEINHSIYVHQPEIIEMPEDVKNDYIYSTMLMHEEKTRMRIDLIYNSDLELIDVYFKKCLIDDIPESEYKRLKKRGIEYIKTRAESMKKQKGLKKIGRNAPCPCGSGKKYKRCCIDRI